MFLVRRGGGQLLQLPSLGKMVMVGREISTTPQALFPYEQRTGPKNWPRYNNKMYPPQGVEETPRPGFVCHMKTNIKYSPDKMWWIACLVRGMSVDEAVKQLDYVRKKGAHYVKQTILEAQELAVQQHGVEFKSNLWISDSFTTKGLVVKGIRRHARMRFGLVCYKHCHYYVTLEEGAPPKDYYLPEPDGPGKLKQWLQERREQRIFGTY